MHRICTWSRTNSVSFCSKDCFYAFYKLGNAPKSVSAGASPLGKLTALPQTPSLWGGGSPRPPQEPHPLLGPSGFGHTGYMLCRPPTPPKINPSYGLGSWLPPFCEQNLLLFIQPKWQLRRTYFFNHYNVLS